MSTRYFKSGHSAAIYADRDQRAVSESINLGLVEVQVVPLDAIVIRREELPGINASAITGALNVRGVHFDAEGDAEWARRMALNYLAADEYLRAHPPVDEAQVKAFTAIIDAARTAGEPETLARRLVEAGATAPVLKEES